ncbi:hypothetical protein N0V93_006047 [Gnomoniopsis smithogilvyi]|uniref:Uncharacterized protein n=1 Tax=Gnomoniopsis smithogilvyi TaxID=1191159 RepID=A0A9W8YNM3_9PEZI|nr:hypothetical protein N0V93_006047 [Gnomoniopsis smithogilvyi]
MQSNFPSIEPAKTTGASTLNIFLNPPYFHQFTQILSEHIGILGLLLVEILSSAMHNIQELLVLIYLFIHCHPGPQQWDELEAGCEPAEPTTSRSTKNTGSIFDTIKQGIDLRRDGKGSHSPRGNTLENKGGIPRPSDHGYKGTVPTPCQPCEDGQGCGGDQAQQKFGNTPMQADISTSNNHNVDTTTMHPAYNIICATQFASATSMTENASMPWQIALNVEQKAIYRFDPSQSITVSIDQDSFSDGGIREPLPVQLLQKGLEYTVEIINHLQLGIRFEICCNGQVGLVQLKYCQDSTVQLNGLNYISWAQTQFPSPGVKEYTVWIRAPTFWPEYVSSIPNILSHEFGHLLGMRHWNAEKNEAGYPSIQYPPDDYDEQSIMGRFDHPGQLYFHIKDVAWLKKFYAIEAGKRIYEKWTVRDVTHL